MVEEVKLDAVVNKLASLTDVVHPCPPDAAIHLIPENSLHEQLVSSKTIASSSHRMRTLAVELDSVTQSLKGSERIVQADSSFALTADAVRRSKKQAFDKERVNQSDFPSTEEEIAKWVEKRKALDAEIEKEKQEVFEEFKKGLRDGVQLGI